MLCLHVYVCTTCVPGTCEPEEDTGSPRTGVKDDCKPSYGCWELDPGCLEEHLVLLITH